MLEKSNKHLYFAMRPEIALALVHEWIKSGEGPLGMQFGWIQPDNDDICTLGSVYTDSYDRDLYNLLFTEDYNYAYGKYDKTLNFSLDQTKRILRILKDNDIDYHSRFNIKLSDVIFQNENIQCKFSELDDTEKCMYRLSILMLNTMTEGHNLACEYLEYLAHVHYHSLENDKNWTVYDNDNRGYKQDILDILMETPEDMTIYLPYDSPEYHIDYFTNLPDYNPYLTVREYVENLENEYAEDRSSIDIVNQVFNLDVQYPYDRDEILDFLTWVIGWIIDEYMQGNLTFTYTDNVDSKELKQWLYNYDNQMIMDI